MQTWSRTTLKFGGNEIRVVVSITIFRTENWCTGNQSCSERTPTSGQKIENGNFASAVPAVVCSSFAEKSVISPHQSAILLCESPCSEQNTTEQSCRVHQHVHDRAFVIGTESRNLKSLSPQSLPVYVHLSLNFSSSSLLSNLELSDTQVREP